MLQLNSDNTTNNIAPLRNKVQIVKDSFVSNKLYPKLAKLSHKKQWILYTSHCPRPVQSELGQHNINCASVIHLKPSNQYSEEEIVIKAVEAGTASAVVASQHLDSHARARIFMVAKLNCCSVFFLDHDLKPNHLCH
ncbi:hypothetical protein [Vibrio algarum]|uniref:UspA domain-containing protein n=1 Tax=Vibrio algarum TaxID=3020714 RepID=A0ABT4YSB4_9VIBR|nr:hypothetical protein [Vibrio sp. KJ40-1]MDB1123943.1 hypothetical protein [Vibrio sp. KJ40-1]